MSQIQHYNNKRGDRKQRLRRSEMLSVKYYTKPKIKHKNIAEKTAGANAQKHNALQVMTAFQPSNRLCSQATRSFLRQDAQSIFQIC
jgi:hypothetical protein